MQVERRTFEDGAWSVRALPLAEVAPFPEPRAAAAPEDVPHVVAGDLLLHLMLQITSCVGYEVEPVAENVVKVGGAWDLGIHAVATTETSVGVDTHDPAGSLLGAVVHQDRTLAGLGIVTITETRIVVSGSCLFLIGSMSGDGVFAFDETWPSA